MQYILTEQELNKGFEIEKAGESDFMEDYATKMLQDSLHKDGFLTTLQYEDQLSMNKSKLIIYKRVKKQNKSFIWESEKGECN